MSSLDRWIPLAFGLFFVLSLVGFAVLVVVVARRAARGRALRANGLVDSVSQEAAAAGNEIVVPANVAGGALV